MAELDKDIVYILGRIEGKVDTLHEALTKHVSDDAKVEERVRKVERKQSWFMGGLASLGAIAGASWTYLMK